MAKAGSTKLQIILSSAFVEFWIRSGTERGDFVKIVFCLALLLSLSSAAIQSEQQNGSLTAEISIQASSRMVVIPTIVRSRRGEFISDLKAADFQLTDNDELQSLTVEQTKDKDLAVAVVMQTGAGSQQEFQNYKTWNRLLGVTTNSAVRKVALITFDSKPRQIWNFPDRWDGLAYALDHPEVGDDGAAVLDAVSMGLLLLQQQPPQMRRILLLLSQPQDAGSRIGAPEFLRRLAEANTAIYSVSFPPVTGRGGSRLPQSCPLAKDASVASGSLRESYKEMCRHTAAELAILSGGEHVEIRGKDELEQSIATLHDAFTNSYILTFRPVSSSEGFHILSLRVPARFPGAKVSSRGLYWMR